MGERDKSVGKWQTDLDLVDPKFDLYFSIDSPKLSQEWFLSQELALTARCSSHIQKKQKKNKRKQNEKWVEYENRYFSKEQWI